MYTKLSLIVVVVCTLLFCGMTQSAGLDVTAPGDTVQGVPNDGVTDGGGNFGWPSHEYPALAIDDDTSTKYLHFKGDTQSTGFQVTPSASQTIVVGLTFTTANDAAGRDPVAFEFYGSNVSINGPYTLIASGDIVDFSKTTAWPRFTMNETPVFFDNDVAYDHYQVLFTAVRSPGSANSMQISEVELLGKGPIAANPDPADGAVIRDKWVNLNWLSGDSADSHDVYFGDDPDAVDDAVGGTPQTLNRYYPGELEFDKTYYWRVDEFDGAATHKGDIWSFTTVPADAFWAAAYYVDQGNRVANDGNPGTEARPFKTIGGGVQSLQPGDTLLIKAGTYRETAILTRSGTEAEPIRIRAYPGDEGKVIINAAEPVTNWQRCAGPGDCAGNPYWEHIYVADVAALVQSHPDSAFAVRQVFQHGELLNRSRYPNAGWSYPTTIADPKQMFTDSSLSKPNGYFVGSVCHIKTAVWQLDQIPITGFSRGAITLASSPRYDMSTRFGYYITSIVGEINDEGEWAYDPVEKKLFLWPKGDVAQGVEFTYREYCLRTYGGTGWNIVRGLAMRNAYTYGIWLYQANNMTVENNTIEHTYTWGIHLQSSSGPCNNNQIVGNTVKYSCSRGINVNGAASHNNIEGNYVYATATEHFGGDLTNGRGLGMYIAGPFTRVYNNRIDRTGYTGLYLAENTLSREAFFNYITNIGLALSDGGGIYTGGFSAGPEKDHIHQNIIEDAIGCLSMDQRRDTGLPVTIERYSGDTPGIYVDEEGNNRIIEDNTVIGSHMAGIFFHGAPGNLVQNNTLYGNKVTQVYFVGRTDERMRLVDDVVLNNIMFATDAQQRTLYLTVYYEDVHFGQSDNNYFYNPYNSRHVHVSRYDTGQGRTVYEDLTLNGWRALSGYDENSREFSYLEQFNDITVATEKTSRIIYNTSLEAITVDLEPDKYCDVQGNKIYGSVTLQPFESKILISSDFETPDLLLEAELNQNLKVR
ncbi:MAG: right-handed parallel beta-helix repeat-containing protein [Sedimentisphaerales bacterium]